MKDDPGKEILVEVAKEALKEPAQEVGAGLSDLIRLLFTPISAARIYRDAWLEDFKDRIQQKFSRIPEGDQVPPPLQIVGPALEASRYFIQQEEMRELFANLIARACDRRNAQSVHPAFVAFLTQMTPLEASLLRLFRPETEVRVGMSVSTGDAPPERPVLQGTGIFHYPERCLPVVSYHLDRGTVRKTVHRDVIKALELGGVEELSAAAANLIRMGLIGVSYRERLPESSYGWALETESYRQLLRYTRQGCTEKPSAMAMVRGELLVEGSFERLSVEKGIAYLTQLGCDFMKCCVIEQEVRMPETGGGEAPS